MSAHAVRSRLSPGALIVLIATVAVAALGSTQPAQAAGRCGAHAWCDRALTPDARAGLLLHALRPDERIALLAGDDVGGIAGGPDDHTGTSDGVARLDLPTTYYSDGPVGPRQGRATAMPSPSALAATFDPKLASAYGALVADEVRKKGNDVVFAPMINVVRTPLGGRSFEGFGEDPWLISRMAVAWIRAAQAQGVIATVKHFAANNQEGDAGPAANASRPEQVLGPRPITGDRMKVDARVDQRTLREVYLPAFEAAVREARAGSVMCAYNRLNGPFACQNSFLLEQVLRREWGFRGYVVADYLAAHDTAPSLRNGLDFEPWPPDHTYGPARVAAALAAGSATMAMVDGHVRRILRAQFAAGVFDRAAYRNDDAQIDKAAHARTAQRVEERAITLLRNARGLLPLGRPRSIAVIGAAADRFVTGGGSGKVVPFAATTVRAAIVARARPGTDVSYDDGSDPARAAAAARGADIAVVVASDYETEGSDRFCLTLECPDLGDQDGLIERVAAANPRTAVVLQTGAPVLTPWRGRIAALLEAWYPGQNGGPAIARVLFGDSDPGGRLPMTFPARAGDLPTAGDPWRYPGVGDVVHYAEGVLVGHRWYDARHKPVAYPFGHGLSFTHFALRGLRVRTVSGGARGATVSLELANTGSRAGTAVPQVYVRVASPRPGVVEPPRKLAGFVSVTLRRGERRRVTIRLDPHAFSWWDTSRGGWRTIRGCWGIDAGTSSRAIALRAVAAPANVRCAARGRR